MNKHQLLAIVALFIVAAVALLFFLLIEKYGWQSTVFAVAIVSILIYAIFVIKNRLRYASLLKKYNDNDLAKKIMRRTLWKGQTAEQVIDAIGKPRDIDQKVLKTKTKETWKYFPSGRRRYGLRITLDNNVVVGWDKKV